MACVMVLQSFLIRIKGCCCVVFRGHRLQQPNAGGPSEVSERHSVGEEVEVLQQENRWSQEDFKLDKQSGL